MARQPHTLHAMAATLRRFHVTIAGVTIPLEFRDGLIIVGGGPANCSVERLGGGWYHVIFDGASHSVQVAPVDEGMLEVRVNGAVSTVEVRGERDILLERFGISDSRGVTDKAIRAPMPGLVLNTLVTAGAAVTKGEGLLVLEAMKMENEIRSIADGVVKHVHVQAGEAVTKGDLLVELE